MIRLIADCGDRQFRIDIEQRIRHIYVYKQGHVEVSDEHRWMMFDYCGDNITMLPRLFLEAPPDAHWYYGYGLCNFWPMRPLDREWLEHVFG